MEITKMRAENLRKWIKNLEITLKYENDDRNIAIYRKWLNEAYKEQEYRFKRRERYLNEANKNSKRSIY